MTDPTPRNPAESAGDEQPFPTDALSRLASLSQRTPSVSPFARRELPDDTSPGASEKRVEAPDAPAPFTLPTAGTVARLTRVDAAQIWADGRTMASWLAANGDAIAETLGLSALTFEPPDVNIALGTASDGRPACIVCETGPSTDEGLGVLLRIAAVQDGGTVAWVTGDPADTHAAALSWLNRSTSPRFHLVRVAGVRIDGSLPAPLFETVVRPPRGSASGTDAAPRAAEDPPRRRVEDHVSQG